VVPDGVRSGFCLCGCQRKPPYPLSGALGAETWNVQGYPLRQILVDSAVKRPYGLAGPVVGGRQGEMGAEATAEVYLSRYEFNAWDCSPNPETPMVYYWFRFTWRIRLVR